MAEGSDADERSHQVRWGVLVLAAGVVAFALDLRSLYVERILVARWTEVEAEIVGSDVRHFSQVGQTSEDCPNIDYVYDWQAETHVGHCCGQCRLGSADKEVLRFVRDNPTEHRVAVYVNPANPRESRLKASIPEFSVGSVLALPFILIFVVYGAYLILPPHRRARLGRLLRRKKGQPVVET